jgi:sn-glycerol 3-phosphate transport system ATP-binding protein
MADVRFEQVTKVFAGGATALDDLTLRVEDGEFMILVGPSGCGKTTALRLVAGLEKPTSGKIGIDGRVVNDVSPRDRDIAMVFQNYALYPHMTVYRNLAFGLRERKAPRAEIDRRVREASAMLGLDDLLKRRPAQLSGGQRQRVAMGRALVREPKAFLLDEPLSNLDAKLRVQMRAELKRLHQQLRITTIYVTHDQVEAMTLGDRIAVMSDGRLQQLGYPQDVYDQPTNLFVAGFIGSPPMNLLRATVRGGYLVAGSLRIPLDGIPDGEIVVGIRPESLTPARDGLPTIDLDVEVVEPLGDEVVVRGTIEGRTVGSGVEDLLLSGGGGARATVTTRLDPHTRIRPGERIPLSVEAHATHLFDADTGAAIR